MKLALMSALAITQWTILMLKERCGENKMEETERNWKDWKIPGSCLLGWGEEATEHDC